MAGMQTPLLNAMYPAAPSRNINEFNIASNTGVVLGSGPSSMVKHTPGLPAGSFVIKGPKSEHLGTTAPMLMMVKVLPKMNPAMT